MDELTFNLDKYIISYPNNFKVNIFETQWFYGITFKTKHGYVELIHNPILGNRMIISDDVWMCKDVPFKEETFWLLPDGVTVKIR